MKIKSVRIFKRFTRETNALFLIRFLWQPLFYHALPKVIKKMKCVNQFAPSSRKEYSNQQIIFAHSRNRQKQSCSSMFEQDFAIRTIAEKVMKFFWSPSNHGHISRGIFFSASQQKLGVSYCYSTAGNWVCAINNQTPSMYAHDQNVKTSMKQYVHRIERGSITGSSIREKHEIRI